MANATAGPFGKPDPTTAQLLGAYRRELEAEGIDPSTTQTLVIEAARQLLRDEPLAVGPVDDLVRRLLSVPQGEL